jgi:hypothetical protein
MGSVAKRAVKHEKEIPPCAAGSRAAAPSELDFGSWEAAQRSAIERFNPFAAAKTIRLLMKKVGHPLWSGTET